MKGMLEGSKDITWLNTTVKITSSLSEDNLKEIDTMAEELCRHSKLETTFDLSNQMTEDERITAVRRTAETTVE